MRENGFRAIGGLAQRLTSGIAKGRGASIARLRAEWSAIVGPELARVSRPEALLPVRGRSGKALRLRVPGAPSAIPAPDPETVRRATERAASVKDPALRAALARLGARLASRRQVLVGVLGAAAVARELRAEDLSRDKLLGALPDDHVLGKADAPNILIDYASFTCPHCANFYIAVMPSLRPEWIDTGRLRLIHRHFPSDLVATRASQLAECAGPDKFFARVELLFRRQVDWLSVGNPEVEMVKALADQGVPPQEAQACFVNDRLLDKVIADVQSGQTLGVTFTPTLFINEENYANPGGAEAISAILRQVGR